MTTNQEAVTEIAKQSPESAGLVHAILEQSRLDIAHTTELIENGLRNRIKLLENAILTTQKRLEKAHMGSAREYEHAVAPLWLVHIDDKGGY